VKNDDLVAFEDEGNEDFPNESLQKIEEPLLCILPHNAENHEKKTIDNSRENSNNEMYGGISKKRGRVIIIEQFGLGMVPILIFFRRQRIAGIELFHAKKCNFNLRIISENIP